MEFCDSAAWADRLSPVLAQPKPIMLPTSDSETPASSAFLTFLRHAAAARQNGTAEAETTWLDAAAQCHPLDDESIESLIATLLEQHRHNDAIELAAIIAQLDPHRALAHFRFGYALQMANRHSEAIAPYRRALAIDPKLPQLRNNLAGALALTGGDLSEQLALLESAVHDDPATATHGPISLR
jgi:Flp pilus assembly protein TadD, contains TPR repeats